MSDIRTIGVLGGKGMLGSDLVEFLGKDFETTVIDKENYDGHHGVAFDVFINANGNSRRFWANEHPLEDFEASTISVYKSVFDFQFEKYIYISSPDVYENPSGPEFTKEDQNISSSHLSSYGFHKYLSECIVQHCAKEYLIIRPASLIGKGLKKGPVYDILNDESLFITPESQIQFIPTSEVANAIRAFLKAGIKNEIFNVAGKSVVSVKRIAELAGKSLTTKSDAEEQHYEMAIGKLEQFFPIRTSEEYLKEFLSGHTLTHSTSLMDSI